MNDFNIQIKPLISKFISKCLNQYSIVNTDFDKVKEAILNDDDNDNNDDDIY
jgi:hypothetical protein